MRTGLLAVVSVVFVALLLAPMALAGSAHFIDSAFVVSRDDNTLTVSGKEAGLGDEPQIHVELTVTAACINPGDNHPKAANKQSLAAEGDFPVQNGKANFSLSVAAAFQPSCSPPMTVVFGEIVVTDAFNGLVYVFSGTY